MPKANNEAEAGPDAGAWQHLKRLAYFAAVVETGSFTAAADRLGITKAVVSQQVARLEREFRTSLLVRSTRKVAPTAAGQAFYQRCAAILAEADSAFGELAEAAAAPTGLLRLTAPFDYGISVVVPAIAAFSQRYPQCRVDARFSDQTLDLTGSAMASGGGIELAIRVGWLTEPEVQARRIGQFRQLLVAAPRWQDQLQALAGPQDLTALPLVANTALRDPLRWQFSGPQGEVQAVQWPVAAIQLDATLAVREAVLAGVGLSVLPDYAIAADLAAGRLLPVLPAWQLPTGGIHAVFPAARFRPAKVRAFVDLLAEQLAAQAPATMPGRLPPQKSTEADSV